MTCLITQRALESLLLIFKICLFRENDSSIVMPRNLHEVAGVKTTLSIVRMCADKSNVLLGGCITMYYLLVAFRDSLFSQNQLKMVTMGVLALLNKRDDLESDKKTVVSSANDKIFSVVL